MNLNTAKDFCEKARNNFPEIEDKSLLLDYQLKTIKLLEMFSYEQVIELFSTDNSMNATEIPVYAYKLLQNGCTYEQVLFIFNKLKFGSIRTLSASTKKIKKEYWEYMFDPFLTSDQLRATIKALSKDRIIDFKKYGQHHINIVTADDEVYKLFLANEKYFYPTSKLATFRAILNLLKIGQDLEKYEHYISVNNYTALEVACNIEIHKGDEKAILKDITASLMSVFSYQRVQDIKFMLEEKNIDRIMKYIHDGGYIDRTRMRRIVETFQRRCPMCTDYIAKLELIEEKIDDSTYQHIVEKREERTKKILDSKFAKHNEILDTARSTIHKFMDGECRTKIAFTIKYGITEKEFKNYLEAIKELDPVLYETYIEYVSKERDRVYAIVRSIIDNIIKDMREVGFRDFSLFEYHSRTKMTVQELYEFMVKHNYKQSDIAMVKRFWSFNRNKMCYTKIVDMKSAKWVAKGHEFTAEEKDAIIDYMCKNEMPVYTYIFHEVGRRYLAGDLELIL